MEVNHQCLLQPNPWKPWKNRQVLQACHFWAATGETPRRHHVEQHKVSPVLKHEFSNNPREWIIGSYTFSIHTRSIYICVCVCVYLRCTHFSCALILEINQDWTFIDVHQNYVYYVYHDRTLYELFGANHVLGWTDSEIFSPFPEPTSSCFNLAPCLRLIAATNIGKPMSGGKN